MSAGWVVDSSVGIAWVHPGQATPATEKLLDAICEGVVFVVPALWYTEMANALLVLQRRNKLTAGERKIALEKLSNLNFTTDEESAKAAFTAASTLAERHSLTVYDATYLEVALRRKLSLATLDDDLTKAARRVGVKLL